MPTSLVLLSDSFSHLVSLCWVRDVTPENQSQSVAVSSSIQSASFKLFHEKYRCN